MLILNLEQYVAPWMIAEFFANLPINIFFTGAYALILYFMTNMRTENLAGNLFLFIAINVLLNLVRLIPTIYHCYVLTLADRLLRVRLGLHYLLPRSLYCPISLLNLDLL